MGESYSPHNGQKEEEEEKEEEKPRPMYDLPSVLFSLSWVHTFSIHICEGSIFYSYPKK